MNGTELITADWQRSCAVFSGGLAQILNASVAKVANQALCLTGVRPALDVFKAKMMELCSRGRHIYEAQLSIKYYENAFFDKLRYFSTCGDRNLRMCGHFCRRILSIADLEQKRECMRWVVVADDVDHSAMVLCMVSCEMRLLNQGCPLPGSPSARAHGCFQ